MSQPRSTTVFWIEVEKIRPNPYQPRREFDEGKLRELADSIRQYGVLQPIVVSRKEIEKDDGGIMTVYEVITGERRLRASKMAGIREIPSIIRTGDDDKLKLEMAIIENLQREDLNTVERARAFDKLAKNFNFSHRQIAKKVGKSREYVSNTIRVLNLPEDILDALSEGRISEGHTRPIMMLDGRPEEQQTLFKEIIHKKITVRDAERIARRIATDRVRKRELDPELLKMENRLREALGTRVYIEKREVGGKIMIDFFSSDDLETLLARFQKSQEKAEDLKESLPDNSEESSREELYNIKNFSI